MPETKRPLKVFLSHAHSDAGAVRALYDRLIADGVDVWLDKEKLLPGQDWRYEIQKAVREADVVIVCHSKNFNQEGFRQREVRWALDVAMEKPEGEIFIIPARLEECDVLDSLKERHWVDLFETNSYEFLMRSLQARAANIGATLRIRKTRPRPKSSPTPKVVAQKPSKSGKERSEEKHTGDIVVGGDTSGSVIVTGSGNTINMGVPPGISKETHKTKDESESGPLPVLKVEPKPENKKRKPLRTEYMVALIGAAATIIAGILGSPYIGKLLEPAPTPIAPSSMTPSPATTKVQTLTLAPSSTEITDDFGVGMMFVPASEFTMGNDKGFSNEQPVHKVYLDAFYIDKYEITNALYKTCVEADVCKIPVITQAYFNLAREGHPVVYVDWSMANDFCRWRGARLPTEAQWEKAARGTDERKFPWGEVTPVIQYANYDGTGTKHVGSYPFVKSPYGVLDMAGNVSEWVSDWYSLDYYQFVLEKGISNPLGPQVSPFSSSHNYYGRVFRGGSWRTTDSSQLSTTYRFHANPHLYADDLGFRCARDVDQVSPHQESPTPATNALSSQDWNPYVVANQGSTIEVQPDVNNSVRIKFNLLQGDWAAVYKKLSTASLAGTSGLIVSYKGHGAPNTMDVKLFHEDETFCHHFIDSKTNTNDVTETFEISYSEFECASTILDLENLDRLDISFSNWPDNGDESGEGEVVIESIQLVP